MASVVKQILFVIIVWGRRSNDLSVQSEGVVILLLFDSIVVIIIIIIIIKLFNRVHISERLVYVHEYVREF